MGLLVKLMNNSPSSLVPDVAPDVAPEVLPSTPGVQPQPTVMAPPPSAPQLPGWRFWLPLVIQMGILVAIPAQDAYTYAVGTTIVLETRPVDPYDFLRGYSQTLSYQISDPATLRSLPGGDFLQAPRSGQGFYLVLEKPEIPENTKIPAPENPNSPSPWQLIRVSETLPKNRSPDQVVLQGKVDRYGSLEYGLERYYMPADRREQLNTEIRDVQWSATEQFRVEAKVDDRGNAVPLSLWVSENRYEF
jgi:uncharacterized membrane-anchored protein